MLVLAGFLLAVEIASGADCGGVTPCSCGDSVVEDYTMTADLAGCANNGLYVNTPYLTIDCNGHAVSGSGFDSGIVVTKNYTTIKNCNIQDFSYGIEVRNRYNDITNNTFSTNGNYGVYITFNYYDNNDIWNNNFYNSGIYYLYAQTYKKNNFCIGGIGNRYFDGAEGPGCGCAAPTDNLYIDSSLTFCPGTYDVESMQVYPNIAVDCNGAVLNGSGSGHGIDLGPGNNTVKNCIFQNHDRGISMDGDYNNITNNIFKNNNYGIYILGGGNANNSIWNNDFYDAGVWYQFSSEGMNNSFCVDGVGNNYYSGAEGPQCDCIAPISNLDINMDTTLCTGTYNMVFGLGVYSDVTLDCNNAILNGTGSASQGEGAYFSSDHNSVVKNCIIQNYKYGVYLLNSDNNTIKDSTIKDNSYYGIYLSGSDSNNIRSNTIVNNDIHGIYLIGTNTGNKINYNYIYGNTNYELYNSGANTVNAEYNWWGTITNIDSEIYDDDENALKGVVDFEPYLTSGPANDLSLTGSDISLTSSSDEITISAIVHNGNTYISQAEVEFIESSNGVLVKNKTITITNINPSSAKTASIIWNLTSGNLVYVFIDPNGKIYESNKDNNYASKEYIGLPKFYVEADVGLTKINAEIEDFIKDNLKFGFPVDNSNEADVLIAVARHNPLLMWHFAAAEDGWGFSGNIVKNQGRTENKPYGAVIGSLDKGGKHNIYIEGNDVEGFIAGSKELIKQEDRFIEGEDSFLIDGNNIDALAVYDYLHTPVNLPYYKKNSDGFAGVVRKTLNNDMYDYEDKTVTADGIVLRLRHLEPAYSDNLIDFKDKAKLPVVLARGLWSNLSSWQEFGEELANDESRDTWLIEITGGPGQDCDSCPDYTFDNLTDLYVPALLNGVLNFTNKTKLQYVGFSNGCRAALSSLEKGKFNPSKVETFVAVGCPGAFEKYFYHFGVSPFAEAIKENGATLSEKLSLYSHLTEDITGKELLSLCNSYECQEAARSFQGKNKISYNLADTYFKWIINDTDIQPGGNLTLENFKLVYGTMSFIINLIASGSSDGVVSVKDSEAIYGNIAINNTKEIKRIRGVKHTSSDASKSLSDSEQTKEEVKSFLSKEVS